MRSIIHRNLTSFSHISPSFRIIFSPKLRIFSIIIKAKAVHARSTATARATHTLSTSAHVGIAVEGALELLSSPVLCLRSHGPQASTNLTRLAMAKSRRLPHGRPSCRPHGGHGAAGVHRTTDGSRNTLGSKSSSPSSNSGGSSDSGIAHRHGRPHSCHHLPHGKLGLAGHEGDCKLWCKLGQRPGEDDDEEHVGEGGQVEACPLPDGGDGHVQEGGQPEPHAQGYHHQLGSLAQQRWHHLSGHVLELLHQDEGQAHRPDAHHNGELHDAGHILDAAEHHCQNYGQHGDEGEKHVPYPPHRKIQNTFCLGHTADEEVPVLLVRLVVGLPLLVNTSPLLLPHDLGGEQRDPQHGVGRQVGRSHVHPVNLGVQVDVLEDVAVRQAQVLHLVAVPVHRGQHRSDGLQRKKETQSDRRFIC